MFNLLPEKLKKEIKTEYRFRWYTTILWFLFCVQVSFLIFLLPVWLSSYYKEKETVSQFEELNKSESGLSISSAVEVIRSLNSKLNVLNSALEYPKLTPLVDVVISNKTSSISIDEFTFITKDSKNATLIIGGTSSTRDSLVNFAKKLEETKAFSDVDLPISNLAKDRNIDFSITLTISQ